MASKGYGIHHANLMEKELEVVHDMRGRILAHRGLWSKKSDQNTLDALVQALDEGFGLETDLRNYTSQIVISHDIPQELPLTLNDLLTSIGGLNISPSQVFGWNIKADGLVNDLSGMAMPGESFFFDMSFPQELQFRKVNMPVAKRISEYEKCNLLDGNDRIWLDAFESDWYLDDLDFILPIIHKTRVTIVSSELHGREVAKGWDFFKKYADHDNGLSICTDRPHELLSYL